MTPSLATARLTALALGLVALPVSSAAQMTSFEQEVLAEVNLVRTDPAAYARHVERLLEYFDGNLQRIPGTVALRTDEGPRAVREAVAALRAQRPLRALTGSRGLSRAARDHAEDLGPRGGLGHTGKDGSRMDTRISRYGMWDGSAAENISYGSESPRDVVISLLVDDGVPGRGHRANILSDDWGFAGVGCGTHAKYRTMCVIDFAGAYREGS